MNEEITRDEAIEILNGSIHILNNNSQRAVYAVKLAIKALSEQPKKVKKYKWTIWYAGRLVRTDKHYCEKEMGANAIGWEKDLSTEILE
jgi:hypothetical protein